MAKMRDSLSYDGKPLIEVLRARLHSLQLDDNRRRSTLAWSAPFDDIKPGVCRIDQILDNIAEKQRPLTRKTVGTGFHFSHGWIMTNGQLVDGIESAGNFRFTFPKMSGRVEPVEFEARFRQWMGGPIGDPEEPYTDIIDGTYFAFKLGSQLLPPQDGEPGKISEEWEHPEMMSLEELQAPDFSERVDFFYQLDYNDKPFTVYVIYCKSLVKEGDEGYKVVNCRMRNPVQNECGTTFGELKPIRGGLLPDGVAGAPVLQQLSSGYVCIGYVAERDFGAGTMACVLWSDDTLTGLLKFFAAAK